MLNKYVLIVPSVVHLQEDDISDALFMNPSDAEEARAEEAAAAAQARANLAADESTAAEREVGVGRAAGGGVIWLGRGGAGRRRAVQWAGAPLRSKG